MHQANIARLVAVLYDNDLSEEGFHPFLRELSLGMHANVVAIQAHNSDDWRGSINVAIGVSPQWLEDFQRLSTENPWYQRGGATLIANGIADDEGLISTRELRTTRFYQDILRPVDLAHGMALCLSHKENGYVSALTINRSARAGYYDNDARMFARALLPHIRNAFAIHQRLQALDAEARTFRSALEKLNDGVMMLSARGTVLFANEAAHRELALRRFISLSNGRLIPAWPGDLTRLTTAIDQAVAPGAAQTINVWLRDRFGRLVGSIALNPCFNMGPSIWTETKATVIAFVRARGALRHVGAETLRIAFGITRAEARLVDALLCGLTLEQAACRLGVTRNTVRTQLRSLLEKTGTNRQVELLRALWELT